MLSDCDNNHHNIMLSGRTRYLEHGVLVNQITGYD